MTRIWTRIRRNDSSSAVDDAEKFLLYFSLFPDSTITSVLFKYGLFYHISIRSQLQSLQTFLNYSKLILRKYKIMNLFFLF